MKGRKVKAEKNHYIFCVFKEESLWKDMSKNWI